MTELPPADPAQTTRSPLWMRITLVVSLALNLLVIGIVVGALATRGGREDGTRPLGALRDLGPTPFIVALDPEHRRDLAQSMRGEAASLRENREELRTRFEALLAALRADPFDPDAVAALLGEQRQVGARRQAIGEKLLLDHLASMSGAERAAYADRLDKSLRRGAKR
ncbi:MAG: periplasmic heavy metal sensor [Pseudomonadota bacterium]